MGAWIVGGVDYGAFSPLHGAVPVQDDAARKGVIALHDPLCRYLETGDPRCDCDILVKARSQAWVEGYDKGVKDALNGVFRKPYVTK